MSFDKFKQFSMRCAAAVGGLLCIAAGVAIVAQFTVSGATLGMGVAGPAGSVLGGLAGLALGGIFAYETAFAAAGKLLHYAGTGKTIQEEGIEMQAAPKAHK